MQGRCTSLTYWDNISAWVFFLTNTSIALESRKSCDSQNRDAAYVIFPGPIDQAGHGECWESERERETFAGKISGLARRLCTRWLEHFIWQNSALNSFNPGPHCRGVWEVEQYRRWDLGKGIKLTSTNGLKPPLFLGHFKSFATTTEIKSNQKLVFSR